MKHLQAKGGMTRDFLTKPLAGIPFLHLRPLLLGVANHVCIAIYLAVKHISTTF